MTIYLTQRQYNTKKEVEKVIYLLEDDPGIRELVGYTLKALDLTPKPLLCQVNFGIE